jgi:hypothetical protein
MVEGRRAALHATLAQPTAGDGDPPLTFVASSTAVNRYGFALRHDGWRVENYHRNPVVLWAHDDRRPPIGRGRAALRGGHLMTDIEFDRADPFAAAIEQKYRAGFLNAVSVGFDFVDGRGQVLNNWQRMSADQIRDEAFYDLAEVSAVPVPADPNALKQTLSAAASFADLLDDQRVTAETLVRRWLGELLTEQEEPRPVHRLGYWPAGHVPPNVWRLVPRNRWP